MALRGRQNKLSLESLETRQMMAGDVSAYVSGKTLYINGDELDNGVAIVASGKSGVEVVGLDQAGEATTINGNESATFNKVTNVVINTKGGDDLVVATDLTIKGSLNISTGSGADQVVLGDFASEDFDDPWFDDNLGALLVKKALNVDTGSGDDQILGSNTTVKSSANIQTGSGNDWVEFGLSEDNSQHGSIAQAPPPTSTGLTVKNVTNISTGDGDDDVILGYSKSKVLLINTGKGDDDVALDTYNATTITGVMLPDEAWLELANVKAKVATFVGQPGEAYYHTAGVNKIGKLNLVGFEKGKV